MTARRIRVLQSVSRRGATTGFVVPLVDATCSTVDQSYFTWRRALFARYDVLHVHWPEFLLRSRGPVLRSVKHLLFAALLARIVATRTRVLRTVHNSSPHAGGAALERWLVGLLERRTDLFIHLTEATRTASLEPSLIIPHPSYAVGVEQAESHSPVVGRVLFFGVIRQYKGVEQLVALIEPAAELGIEFRVVGDSEEPAIRRIVEEAARTHAHFSARLEFVPDPQLVGEIRASELVVLPYRRMENSGAAMFALSAGRPVLVPSSPTTLLLRREVGARWVRIYDGPLTASVVAEALADVRSERGDGARPELRHRDWSVVGAAYTDSYGRVLATRRMARRRIRRLRPE